MEIARSDGAVEGLAARELCSKRASVLSQL
jgi:hypothetical protein